MATPQVKGKVAIITGASSGIGRAIATRFVNEGGKVAMADITDGEKIAEEFNANKSEHVAFFHKTDVSKWDDLISLFDKTKETFGRIDIVINNAGITDPLNGMLLDSVKGPDFDKVLDVDLMGVIYGTKLAFQYLRQNNPQGGLIINTASVVAVYPMFTYGVYCAAKAGVIALSRSMAQVGHLFNITVNVVCPSVTKTGMSAKASGIPDHWWSPIDEVVNAFFKCIYDTKINGSVFSVLNTGIKEESFESFAYPPALEEMHQGNHQYYLGILEEEKKNKSK